MSVRFASTNHPVRRLGWRAAGRGLIAPALARAANDNLCEGAQVTAAGGTRFDPSTEALLELARESLIDITQAAPYAPIYIRLAYTPA